MPRNVTVTFDDGTTHVYQNAPDDITPEAITQRAQSEFGKPITALDGGRQAKAPEAAPPQEPQGVFDGPIVDFDRPRRALKATGEAYVDAAAGLGKGAGDVALGAQYWLGRGINAAGENAVGNWLVNDAERGRNKLAGELAPHKERSPIAAGGGELGGNIAATLPVGGFLAKGAKALGAAPKVVNALQSGGFNLGRPGATTIPGKALDMLIRMGGGAATGGASAGLVDPEQAGTGAAIGALFPPALKVTGTVGKLGKGVIKNTVGAMTGTSRESAEEAFRAGKAGASEFLKNQTGESSFDDVVDIAKSGLDKMRLDRGAEYRSGMVNISNDKSVLSFADIDSAVGRIKGLGNYKGVQTNKHASGVVDEIAEKVAEWKSLNPAEYHTPEGLDALKRAIGDIRDTTQIGTQSRKAADDAYNAVKGTISKQAPTYSKVMKDYSKASDELNEITRVLSLGDNASRDTAIRKLQSLMRNNAQSNYGNRLSLAEQLEQKGGVSLKPAIAGQAMNTWTPRGMTGAIEKAAIPSLATASFFNPAFLPALAAAPLMSPRLMGNALYRAGQATGATQNAVNKASRGLLANPNAPLLERDMMRLLPAILAGQTAQQ